jgi:AcrR family transcriptional regulator
VRGPNRREEVIEVSARLFRQAGYQTTTLDDVANAMGFTKAAIYHYFDSKEDILFEIHKRLITAAVERAGAIVDGPGDAADKFSRILVDHIETATQNMDENTVFFDEHNLLSSERREVIRNLERRYEGLLRQLYRRGVK